MKLIQAIRNHRVLVAVGCVAGLLLASVWLFQFSWGARGPEARLRSMGDYVTTVRAVIDTTGFGIGRTDTDMYRLALLAPTYAQLMTSQPVLSRAEERLGGPLDAVVTTSVDGSVPIITLTVEGADRDKLDTVAQAVVAAFRDYVLEQQEENKIPSEFRLTIRGMGQPTEPVLASNRRVEIGILLLVLPAMTALFLAYRMDNPGQGGSVGAEGDGADSSW